MQWQKSVLCWSVAMVGLPLLPVSDALAARVALVIGNAAYNESPLRNPVNDARAMAAKLQGLNFEVISRENLKVKDIGKTLQAFQSRIKPGDEALFFYAGHGLQVKGTNYLPAVDAEIGSEQDVGRNSINVGEVLELLEESKAGVKLVFLDACRNNPYARSFRSAATGLSKVLNAPSGTLISFATRPGSVAADGTGSHGLYTEQLLAQMKKPGQPVEQVLKDTASAVKRASQGKQEPWQEGNIEGNFYFITGPVTVIQQTTVTPSLDPETEAWNAAKDSNSAAAVAAYLQEYPRGRYASAAKVLLAKLKEPVSPVTPPVAPVTPPPVTPLPVQPTYRTGQELKHCDVCPALVVVPPGSFTMGSPANEKGRDADESPQHQVNINYSLAVGKYEVTRGEFAAFVRATGHDAGSQCYAWTGSTWELQEGKTWRNPGYSQTENDPVSCVNWHDAQAYVGWLKGKTGQAYRLLSEAEWEYVARAGTSSRYSFGDNEAELGNYAWYWDNAGKQTHPVGEKRQNAFGLYDLHGNVHEWVQDCYQNSYNGAPTDGSAVQSNNCASRVLRGGSWLNDPWYLRSANRGNDAPGNRDNLSETTSAGFVYRGRCRKAAITL